MRKLIILLVFISNLSFGQDCELFTKTEYDKMAQKSLTTSREVLSIVNSDGSGGVGIFLQHAKKEKALIFSFKAVGMPSNCIDEGSKVEILFRSGEKFTWRGENRFNCDGDLRVWATPLKGWKREMSYMSSSPVETIRVNGMKGYIQVDLTEEESFVLQNTVKCMWIFGT
jgi:hypothetical protein